MHYEWDLFDGIFASALDGMRKPDVEFYEHLLKRINTTAGETIFVDDQLANVAAAQSVGMAGLHGTDSLVNLYRVATIGWLVDCWIGMHHVEKSAI